MRARIPHTPYTSVLKFVPPTGRVRGVAMHAVSRDSGYCLLVRRKSNPQAKPAPHQWKHDRKERYFQQCSTGSAGYARENI